MVLNAFFMSIHIMQTFTANYGITLKFLILVGGGYDSSTIK